MKERHELKKVNFGEKTLFQLKVGRRPDFIIWVSPKLVTQTENGYSLKLPTENVKLVQGRKNLILLPGGGMNLFNVYTHCALDRWLGWNESSVSIDTCPCGIFAYEPDVNHRAALVLTESPYVEYRWKRAKGRAIDGNLRIEEGFGIIQLDGIVVEIEGEKDDAFASLE